MGSSGGMSRDQTETGWSGHREYLMSRGNYFHKLTVDPDKPSEVTVSRYTPKILPYGKEDAYVYSVWHELPGEEHYEGRCGRFKAQDYDPSHGLNWNTLDTMISSRLGAGSSSAGELTKSHQGHQPVPDLERRNTTASVVKASSKLFALLLPLSRTENPHSSTGFPTHTPSDIASLPATVEPVTSGRSLEHPSDDDGSPSNSPRKTVSRALGSGDAAGGLIDSPSPDKLQLRGLGASLTAGASADGTASGGEYTIVGVEERVKGFIDSMKELHSMDIQCAGDTPSSADSNQADGSTLLSGKSRPIDWVKESGVDWGSEKARPSLTFLDGDADMDDPPRKAQQPLIIGSVAASTGQQQQQKPEALGRRVSGSSQRRQHEWGWVRYDAAMENKTHEWGCVLCTVRCVCAVC
jgi:hypothetical protein